MEEGMSYDDALKQAQELGYAEADPTADVEGHVHILDNLEFAVFVLEISL